MTEREMDNIKLSDNFNLGEFCHTKYNSTGLVIPTPAQIGFLKILAKDVLQYIRDKYTNTTIHINSGLRTLGIYYQLKKRGYPASRTSDHFLVKSKLTAKDFKEKFGSSIKIYLDKSNGDYGINPLGSGAADIIVKDSDTRLLWSKSQMYRLFKRIANDPYVLSNTNQIIFYHDMGGFIHISLRREKIFPFRLDSSRPILEHKKGGYYVPRWAKKNWKYIQLAKK